MYGAHVIAARSKNKRSGFGNNNTQSRIREDVEAKKTL
jgi:hypothetical protein